MIPNIIHFIFGLKENFGQKPFSFIHYLAIKSAYECNKPEAIKFHYKHEPSGEWWEKSKPYLTLSKVEPPKEIFGNPLLHFCHQADVLRLEILLKEGGIYLDIDVLCVNSFEPLRKYPCVMGREENRGLCNAVIMAQPGAEFLKICYEEYRTFRSKGKDQYWIEHSVQLPLKNAQKYPQTIHIEDQFSFYWPDYNASPMILWDRDPSGLYDSWLLKVKKWLALKFTESAYCVHLWEQLWWEDHLKEIDLYYLKNNNNNFSKLARQILFSNNLKKSRASFLRPLMKRMVQGYLKLAQKRNIPEAFSYSLKWKMAE